MEINYTSESRINILKDRTTHCVCKYCGSRLHVRRIIFSNTEGARIEIFCEQCGRIEFGVEQEIYQCAKNFVEKFCYNAYPDIDDGVTAQRMTIAKVCDIIAWADQKRGLLDEHGFKVPIALEKGIAGDVMLVYDNE